MFAVDYEALLISLSDRHKANIFGFLVLRVTKPCYLHSVLCGFCNKAFTFAIACLIGLCVALVVDRKFSCAIESFCRIRFFLFSVRTC